MSRLILKGIGKSFNKVKVLDDISFTVEEGELVSLLGPSGCGKTTALKIIAGLISPDKGEIILGEDSIVKVPVERRGTVIVFQDCLLFPHMNIEENIGFGLRMSKTPKCIIREQVERMLGLVQLKGYNRKYPHELSGGQKQRVALARALAVEPKVLLLDEPFSNLDTMIREAMRDFTLKLQKELKMTTILVTHDKEEALICSDKIAVMLDGRIMQFGTPEELYQKPNSIRIADFFGEKNYVTGSIKDGCFISDILSFRTGLQDMDRAKAMLKPSDIKLFKSGKGNMEGLVKSVRYAGERVYYSVLVNDVEFMVVSPEVFEAGEYVGMNINTANVVIFNC